MSILRLLNMVKLAKRSYFQMCITDRSHHLRCTIGNVGYGSRACPSTFLMHSQSLEIWKWSTDAYQLMWEIRQTAKSSLFPTYELLFVLFMYSRDTWRYDFFFPMNRCLRYIRSFTSLTYPLTHSLRTWLWISSDSIKRVYIFNTSQAPNPFNITVSVAQSIPQENKKRNWLPWQGGSERYRGCFATSIFGRVRVWVRLFDRISFDHGYLMAWTWSNRDRTLFVIVYFRHRCHYRQDTKVSTPWTAPHRLNVCIATLELR